MVGDLIHTYDDEDDIYMDDDLGGRAASSVGGRMSTASSFRPMSGRGGPPSVATTTVLRLQQQPRERRAGNLILYDKTPMSPYGFLKVVCSRWRWEVWDVLGYCSVLGVTVSMHWLQDISSTAYHNLCIQDKSLGRWAASTHQSTDIDSDYRRDLATRNDAVAPPHHEARGRDGGESSISNYGTMQGRNRSQERLNGGRYAAPSPVGRSAREEERRKVLEIEEERLRRERERRGPPAPGAGVSRSASRVSRGPGARTRRRTARRRQNRPG